MRQLDMSRWRLMHAALEVFERGMTKAVCLEIGENIWNRLENDIFINIVWGIDQDEEEE